MGQTRDSCRIGASQVPDGQLYNPGDISFETVDRVRAEVSLIAEQDFAI